MTILFVTHYAEMYGANKSLVDLIDGLKFYGVQSIVVMPRNGDLCTILDSANVPYYIQDFEDWVRQPIKYTGRFRSIFLFLKKLKYRWFVHKFNSKSIDSLHKIIEEKKIDLIYSNSSVFNFGYMYARKYKLPHIWHFREVQEHYNIKWVFSEKAVNRCFRNSDIVFAISNYVKENYEIKNKVRDIIVEYDSVLSENKLLELDLNRKRTESKVNDILTFGMVALIHPNKGQIEAVKALSVVVRKYPKVRLLLVGGGHVTNLKKVINELEMNEKVVILGEMPNPFEAFLDMDIYLMCSKMEGLGRVTLEAMASCLPIIGYKEGGTLEIISENDNGIFYDGDYNELAKKMIYLIENPLIQKKMGQCGRNQFETKYTTEIYAEKIIGHIKSRILLD